MPFNLFKSTTSTPQNCFFIVPLIISPFPLLLNQALFFFFFFLPWFNNTSYPVPTNFSPSLSSSVPLVCHGVSEAPLSIREKKETGLSSRMSRRNNNPKLELKLNLSPPRGGNSSNRMRLESSPSRSATVSPTSPPSSCVSSELNQDSDSGLRYSNSPEATSMVLVGCPRCLMYVMLSEDDPKCPKCKSTVLLDFLHDNQNNNCNMRGKK